MLNGIAPISIIAEVGHQANAESAGLFLDLTRVVIPRKKISWPGWIYPSCGWKCMEGPDGTVFVG